MNQIKTLTKTLLNTEYNPYDTNLPEVFNKIKSIILDELPGLRIEHVGSSSIPGIGGRNTVDVAIPAIGSEHESIKSKLYSAGFIDSPWAHYIPVLVGMVEFKEKDYPILLYVISPDSDIFKDWLKYREHMRNNPEDARQYDQVKQEVINSGKTRNDLYQQGKTPFIVSLMKKIRENN